MEMQFSLQGKTGMCRLAEDLDMQSAEDFVHDNKAFLAQNLGMKELVFELSAVEFMDSTGVGALMQVIRVAREQGVVCRLAGYSPEIQDALELIGVFGVLEE
ncbi:STAS domain-containing protein [Heliobacterium gestii]|uniref:STAS domain-containing protein n=1 Tax=Heliomicrobium gestii TaxID=2699 RepID=A0A845LHA0_HELGE|nr:STAS domain-containing protein [Heliomicrobium gestii]MBM7866372.1 anti-anti-sigma factor [Heliomicrobium gestii]MZP42843.1 STAS domain-containing protein [Heliomicrobium gestii]